VEQFIEGLDGLLEKNRKLLGYFPIHDFERVAKAAYRQKSNYPFAYAVLKILTVFCALILVGLLVLAREKAKLYVWIAYIGLVMPLSVYVQFQEMKKIQKANTRDIGRYFSKFAANCALLIEVGVSVRRAYCLCAESAEPSLIKSTLLRGANQIEMHRDTNSVFRDMTTELSHPLVSEFASLMVQIERYGIGTGEELMRITESAWQKRRADAQVKARELETVLVFPSMIMFSGIMIMLFSVMVMQFL
jgi:hypothetical protein